MHLSSPAGWNLFFLRGAHDVILEFPVNAGGMKSLVMVEDEHCPAFQETVGSVLEEYSSISREFPRQVGLGFPHQDATKKHFQAFQDFGGEE
jgi:hypothetical protein